MTEIPDDHPRRESLETRHRIEEGLDAGVTSRQGLIAQGRGEAYDYLLGEETIPSAAEAERAAAAALLLADHPVVSVNGNVAALAPGDAVALADAVGGDVAVNIFHHSDDRMHAIADALRDAGASDVKGLERDAEIPGLASERGKVDADGIAAADAVVVPLEDGDRCEALVADGKTVIVIDLNPLARSPRKATIPVIDNVVRALPAIADAAADLADASDDALRGIVEDFDAQAALDAAEERIRRGATDDG